MKTCKKCREYKPLDEFPRNRRVKSDGRASRCKDCMNEYQSAWHDAHPEKAAEYARQWRARNAAE